MPDEIAFQLYLLSYMRDSARVGAARRALGASSKEMTAARQRLLDEGFQRPGNRIDIYTAYLGQGFGYARHEAEDPYKVESRRFRFPAWSSLDLVIYSSADGVAGELRFEHPPRQGQLVSNLQTLKIWQTVADDVAALNWPCADLDEWYPMKDVVYTMPDGGRITLCFDFSLLQKILPVRS